MRKLALMGVLALGVVVVSNDRAQAWAWGHTGPWPQTAAFPCVNPPGWYSNTYSYAWQYPWFAYYNYSHGPYANWMAGGGYAYYGSCAGGKCGIHGCAQGYGYAPPAAAVMAPPQVPNHNHPVPVPVPVPNGKKPEPGKVTINLPADAKLLFNGTAATGTGATRSFAAAPLRPGTAYAYELTAEVVRDGRVQTVTERVVVRAGETAKVTLNVGDVATASVK